MSNRLQRLPDILKRSVRLVKNSRTVFSMFEYPINLDTTDPETGKPRILSPRLLEIIQEGNYGYGSLLKRFAAYNSIYESIKKFGDEIDPSRPRWNNRLFPALDMITLYAMLSIFRPKTYLEVGSGNSTKVVFLAKKLEHLPTEIVSIDPAPREDIDRLCNTVIRKPYQEVDPELLMRLKKNDVIFIDGTHRAIPGSDVTTFFTRDFPILPPEIIVQVHDIYLPWDYPTPDAKRLYSEQYLLAAYLLGDSSRYEILMPNYFVIQTPSLIGIMDDIWNHPNLQGVQKDGCSFWLRTR